MEAISYLRFPFFHMCQVDKQEYSSRQAWWRMPLIPALGRQS
ncbi:mCG140369, isoform CRA_b [Mus musculus]|nr:mCG140369, isoform CRA_b [Mus musculus]